MADPVVDLLDGNGARIGEAPGGTFEATLRALAPGAWTLSSALSGLSIQSSRSIDDVAGVRLVDGDRPLFTGAAKPLPGDDFGGVRLVGVGDSTVVTMSGPDAGWLALASRRAYPDPSTEAPWASGYDVRSGVASTVVAEYIEANMGSSALTDRQWPSLAVVNGAVGPSFAWSARLQRLDQLVARICLDTGIICRPTIDLDGTLRVTIGSRSDLSSRIVLSDQSDLSSYDQRSVPATATYLISGGQGDLTARAFATAATAATGANRVEHFIDRRALSEADELANAAATALAASAATTAIRATIAAEAAAQIVFLEHYDVGDVVSVERGDVRLRAAIESVRITLSESEYTVSPQFGEAADNAWTALVRSVSLVRTQIDNSVS